MEIDFKNAKLKKVFNSEATLLKEYGQRRGRLIMRRRAVLEAAPTLAEVPHDSPERCHQLKGSLDEYFAVDLDGLCRLVFLPNHDPVPRKDDKGIDLSKITRIMIMDVGDYH